MYRGIEHFAIASPDPKRLAEWYVNHLQFRMLVEDQGAYFVKARNGSMLEIISSQGERGSDGAKTPGLRHIAIAVDDFDSAYDELRKKSIAFAGAPYEHKGNKLVFFEDSDGNLLHLIQRVRPLP